MADQALRLIKLIKELKISQLAFARKIGVSQPYVSRVCLGKNKISGSMGAAIVEQFPLVNLSWLLSGIGEMFLQTPEDGITGGNPYGDIAPQSLVPDDTQLMAVLSHNLRTVSERWNMFHYQLIEALGVEVGRTGVATYMAGRVMPPVGALLRLEEMTGIPVYDLLTKELGTDELPRAPIGTGSLLANLHLQLERAQSAIQRYLEAQNAK